MPAKTVCKNCDNELTGAYCSSCGQRDITEGITIKETVSDFLSSSFSFEGPLFFTLRSLITRPGALFREFISGKRKSYYKPVQFFILCTVVYLMVVSLTGYDPLAQAEDRQAPERVTELAARSMRAGRFMLTYINHFLVVFALSLALCVKLFFRKRYRYAEYLVAGFYITGMYTLSGLVDVVLDLFDLNMKFWKFFILIAYIVYCLACFLQATKWHHFVKYVLIGVVSVVVYISISFGIAFIAVGG